ncbi:MAG: replication-associated recombination protein A [Chloroflexota bacterium]
MTSSLLPDIPESDSPRVPLAARMRARTLDEFVGQDHIVGPDRVLRRSIEIDRLPSMILWGPPGSGKTTLASVIAKTTHSKFIALSAVSAGVADLRRVVDTAAKLCSFSGEKTIMFIDEIHRFNKAQQDAVLPYVENGTVTMIGATTENPSFEVNAALLSRARVFRLEKLTDENVMTIVRRALCDVERGLGATQIAVDDDTLYRLIRLSDGDARIALTALELAVESGSQSTGASQVTLENIEDVMQRPALLYDQTGDMHFDLISAFIKSVRGSDADASVYWLSRMLEAGEDPLFVARRMILLAAEDIGLADSHALVLACACQQAVHFVGMPEGFLPLTECAIYLATAPKSNSALTAYQAAKADVTDRLNEPVPLHLRNAVTGLAKSQGFGQGYKYAHDYSGHYVQQQHLPDYLAETRYYFPSDQGAEKAIAERVDRLRLHSSCDDLSTLFYRKHAFTCCLQPWATRMLKPWRRRLGREPKRLH